MKKILTLIILFVGLNSNSIAEENWSLIDDTRLITHGEIVWGHQFGFMKDLGLFIQHKGIGSVLLNARQFLPSYYVIQLF